MNRRQDAMRGATQAPAPAPAPAPQAPAPEPQVPAAATQDDKYAKLKELKELLDSGVLTEDEFAAEKAKILEG